MMERNNPNPDIKEFLELLGNPKLDSDRLRLLSNVFRQHVEGMARKKNNRLRSASDSEIGDILMKGTIARAEEAGINSQLIDKARELGILASKNYISEN